jgi:ABC-type polysaccharide/polyol phosphate transport system ATPase subunit
MNNDAEIYVKLNNINLEIKYFANKFRFFDSKKVIIKAHKILNNISLEIKSGDKLGIIGANGAGKSSLLRLIAEIYKPTSGDFIKNGSCLGLFGNIFYDENLLGIEFIKNSLLLYGRNKNEIEQLIKNIINFIDVGDYIYKSMSTYSEGMKARVSLGTIIFAKPSILLVDEGIGAGDRFFIDKTKDIINKILYETPILIMASHDENLLLKFCTKSILMNKGKIIKTGQTQDIIEYYKSKEFEKDFIKNF